MISDSRTYGEREIPEYPSPCSDDHVRLKHSPYIADWTNRGDLLWQERESLRSFSMEDGILLSNLGVTSANPEEIERHVIAVVEVRF